MNLKLFVWHDVLRSRYDSGMMFALANDVDEARRLIREADSEVDHYEPRDLLKEPEVFEVPVAFTVWVGS